MRFISPKIDYAFKKIFGSSQSEQILISFLNAIMYNGERIIESLNIVNPYNPGQVVSLKESYLDVKAVLTDGSIILIEMQIARVSAFSKRVIYNVGKAYTNQLGIGEYYPGLTPVIGVTITDFMMFPQTPEVITQFGLVEQTKKFPYPDQELQFIFVELPKFQKQLSELANLREQWIYFLKEAARLETIPQELGQVSEIELALNIANQANMTVEELEIVDRRGMLLQDEKGRLTYAREEGRAEGQRLGEQQLLLRQLHKRFGELPTSITQPIENLSIPDLNNLGENIFDFDSLRDLQQWLELREN